MHFGCNRVIPVSQPYPLNQMKTPILLTLTRFAKVAYDQKGNPTNLSEQQSIVVHPNDIEEFGQLFIKGRKGSRLVAQVKGEIWEVIRGNNTEFFEQFDKVKKGFWWPRSAYEGVKQFSPENRVITWEAAWK